ncbi:MAG TPA: class I SAM-dependent methyltransferase, partial [Alphaproteobacteria bacterium]|nr:class I SAM-dependent methyltransferase [Alphaproteobacteria bacterium]
AVAKQYSEWVYPAPIEDLAAWARDHCMVCDPSLHAATIWPDGAPKDKISILVAGCGTSQAAILAYTNPQIAVTGIDISAPSLDHAAKLKKKHKLANLDLRELDLHEAAGLGRFDLIYATGVLHHLPEPRAGLAALARATADNGVLCLSFYAKHARAGIYMVQDALRRLKLGQKPEDAALTRKILEILPPWHPAQFYMRGAARDLAFDGGIVDTFLHAEDRGFDVPGILQLTASCNLAFQGWTDNLDYYPDGAMMPDHPAFARISALPDEEQWAAMELLGVFCGAHSFLLRKAGDGKAPRPDFVGSDFLRWIPARRHLLDMREEGNVLQLSRSWHRLALGGFERDLFLAIDGAAECGAIIAARKGNEEKTRAFFARLWRLGHVTFRKA